MISKLSRELRLDKKCRTQHDEVIGTIIPKSHQFKGNTCALQQLTVHHPADGEGNNMWDLLDEINEKEKTTKHKVLRLYNSYFHGCVDQFFYIDMNRMEVRVGNSGATPKYMVNFLNRIGEELSQGNGKVNVELVVRGSLFRDDKNDTRISYKEYWSDTDSRITRKGLDFSGNITNMNKLSILKEFDKFIKKGVRYSTWLENVNNKTLLSCMNIIQYEDGDSNAIVEMSMDTVKKMHNHIYNKD